jgi:hypothetical protein
MKTLKRRADYMKDAPFAYSVGFLHKNDEYTHGEVPVSFMQRLFEYCASPVFKIKGFIICELCQEPEIGPVRAEYNGREIWVGTAEIRVLHNGKVYASPDLIYHYITRHNYQPPNEFITAVLLGPLPGTNEYEEYRSKYWR